MASKDWVPIRIGFEPDAFKYAIAQITAYPEKAFVKYYFQQLQMVVSSGADVMREYIASRALSTPTGIKENRQGRVKSGLMKDSVFWRGGKMSTGNYRFEVGWLLGKPGYAIFQEYGVKNGVHAMHALLYTYEFMRKEIQLLRLGGAPRGKVHIHTEWQVE